MSMIHLAISATAGAALGLFYFGGLWWTVRRIAHAQHPAGLLLASFVLRTLIVLIGFYFVMSGHWERLLACLAGFVMTRIVLIRRVRNASL
ncbi:MAG: hypothetical protein KatS3mg105_4991 [Gemmatales bacterium]|nr:MAG: hypothetical protein KatS3mg105_4991 [Gemmatales bacterium]